eukprot:s382_g4.t1
MILTFSKRLTLRLRRFRRSLAPRFVSIGWLRITGSHSPLALHTFPRFTTNFVAMAPSKVGCDPFDATGKTMIVSSKENWVKAEIYSNEAGVRESVVP